MIEDRMAEQIEVEPNTESYTFVSASTLRNVFPEQVRSAAEVGFVEPSKGQVADQGFELKVGNVVTIE